jgi:predicted TIM-barrel fold metal-dependent hydrolase
MKKLFSIMLFVVLVAGLILSGCAAPSPAPAPKPATAPAASSPVTAPVLSAAPASAIDAFAHVMPPTYAVALRAQLPIDSFFQSIFAQFLPLYVLDTRFKDTSTDIKGYKQVISCVGAPLEEIADPTKAAELARLANDGLAELVKKYPDRFIAALGYLPMNNMAAALIETDRCINELGFKGIMIYTPINDKPLDSPEFIPLYEKMVKYDLPIFIHPWRGPDYPDYRKETISKFQSFNQWGWDFELTIAQARLVYSGIMEKYPTLKFVFHHGGSMVPFLQRFTDPTSPSLQMGNPNTYARLTKPTNEYFRMFYVDTSSLPASAMGNIGSTILEIPTDFYGVDRMLFGTDYPFPGSAPGPIINNIRGMRVSDADKTKIFETNAKKLLKLP